LPPKPAGRPDPRHSLYIFASGKKKSGKSYVCRTWFDSYPYDRIVIDPTHDVREDLRSDGVAFHELDAAALPIRLGRDDEGRQQTWVFCPDMGSATAFDDMDRVAGLTIGRGPILLWCDEFGDQTSGNKTGPNMRRILHHGRHDDISLLVACPRPMDINPLAINQADKVYTFRTQNPDDRDRIAKNIGVAPADFAAANARLSPARHDYTLFDDATNELWIMPPLPRRRAGQHYPPESGGELVGQADAADPAAGTPAAG
jgi:hypothetical protein